MYLDGLDSLFKMVGIALLVFIPFGLWQMVELVVWLFTHITVS